MTPKEIHDIALNLKYNHITENEAKDLLLKICGLNGTCCDNMVLDENKRDGGKYCKNCNMCFNVETY